MIPWQVRLTRALLMSAFVLSFISLLGGVMVNSLLDDTRRAISIDAALVMTAAAGAIVDVGRWVTYLAIGCALAAAGSMRAATRATERHEHGAELSAALETLIAGLAEAEARAHHTREELAIMKAEQARLRHLAALTPDQLEAITDHLTPAAKQNMRKQMWLFLAGALISIGTATLGLYLADQLPWQ
jgi:sulfite exporter TauE/SafE